MVQPWLDAENIPGEAVDVLGIDGPFSPLPPEDPDGSATVVPSAGPTPLPPRGAARDEKL